MGRERVRSRPQRDEQAAREGGIADVAKTLGSSSRNAYASYEQDRTEPTLGKFRELLLAVAPDMAY